MDAIAEIPSPHKDDQAESKEVGVDTMG